MNQTIPKSVKRARAAVHEAIANAYKPYQEEVDAIFERARYKEAHFFLKTEDKDRFLELRIEAIKAGAERMKTALAENPDFLTKEERLPTKDGYNKTGPLFENEDYGFFSYAFAFGPHQVTWPHNHPGLCVSFALQNGSVETVFSPDDAGIYRPVSADFRKEGTLSGPIGPTEEIDLHTIRNPDPSGNMVLVHLYDSFMVEELEKNGSVRTQFEVRPLRNGVYTPFPDIPGEMPIDERKSFNTGEGPIELYAEAEKSREWVKKILQSSPSSGKTPG